MTPRANGDGQHSKQKLEEYVQVVPTKLPSIAYQYYKEKEQTDKDRLHARQKKKKKKKKKNEK